MNAEPSAVPRALRIIVVTDAWHPQQNGVVRVLETLAARLTSRGHDCQFITPHGMTTIGCPTYPEIPLAVFPGPTVSRRLAEAGADAIHIATEGPIGWAARNWCQRRRHPFTTAYHTKFPEYFSLRTRLPLSLPYSMMRRFHAPSSAVLVPSEGIFEELRGWRFANLRQWSHGVDTDVFTPGPKTAFDHLPRPVFLYTGRVTIEKNLSAFLDLDLPGSKVVMGGGPQREELIARYPAAHFIIANGDEELARYYRAADTFVFPSLTDTFGLVMLEALASGVPVAAFPVAGPQAVIGDSGAGILAADLREAALAALSISPAVCRARAFEFPWDIVVDQFLDNLDCRPSP